MMAAEETALAAIAWIAEARAWIVPLKPNGTERKEISAGATKGMRSERKIAIDRFRPPGWNFSVSTGRQGCRISHTLR
jgi:hypothetical protein